MLYYAGDISLASNPCVAVVGARKASEYGKWAANSIGKRLAEHNITVVSGMARGIDSFAHKGALSVMGKTIAILGCGIDICYPQENRALMDKICEKGLILSEYPLGFRPTNYTFPARNRIISGISRATVIVEAGFSSGSLITADCALNQGREVFAVPGNINSIYSIGTNKLISEGAIPIVVIDDIIDYMGINRKENIQFEKKLGKDEKQVLQYIKENGETTVDSICMGVFMEAGIVAGIVTVLEMKGLVCSALGKIFVAN